MASVYLANVTGDGASPDTAFRPAGFDGIANVCLMIDPSRGRALVISSVDTVTGPGVNNLITAADMAALRTAAATTNVGATKRTQINTWLTAGGYAALPAAVTSWRDVLQFVARQVNPTADLATTGIGPT